MNEKTSYLLSETQLVRLRCKHKDCGATLEIPLEKLNDAKYRMCRACERKFQVTDGPMEEVNFMQNFHGALIGLKKASANLEIELVGPMKKDTRLRLFAAME